MKRVRMMGLCVAAVFALGAVVVASASAAAPEFGRCVKTAKGAGKFSNAGCTKEKAPGSYEWLPGPGPEPSWTASSVGKMTLETVNKVKLTCAGASESGSTSSYRTIKASLTLTGCEAFGMKYESAGQAEGTIVTNELEGELGIEKAGGTPLQDKIGIVLRPIGEEPWFNIHCVVGPPNGVITGDAIDPLTTNKMLTVTKDIFKSKRGKQLPEQFEGGKREILESSFEAPSEQTGLTLTMSQTNKEAIEINSVV